MAVNPYFQNARPLCDMGLMESLVVEAIQVYGVNVIYIPRTVLVEDDLLNEITASSFNRGLLIEAYIENFNGFAPNNFFMDRLGMHSPAEGATVSIAKMRFQEEIFKADNNLTIKRPMEGDLIYVPHLSVLFEIKSSGTDIPGKSGGLVHAYRLECQLYKHNSDQFNSADVFDNSLADLLDIPADLIDDVEIHPIKPIEADNDGFMEFADIIEDRR